jgi:5-methylcytosine-specific restriction endonuclease McrA
MARDGWTCQLCGALAEHVDHIRRVADGGADHPANLRALCAGCNLGR